MSKFNFLPAPYADPKADRMLGWLKGLPGAFGMGTYDTRSTAAVVAEIERLRAENADLLEAGKELYTVVNTDKNEPGYNDLAWLNRLHSATVKMQMAIAKATQSEEPPKS